MQDGVRLHCIGVVTTCDAQRAAALVVDIDNVALLIEAHYKPPDVPVVAGRSHHRDHVAVCICGHDGIRSICGAIARYEEISRVSQQLVTAARDHDVNTAELVCEREVCVDVLHMADEDDLVDAETFQPVDLGLNCQQYIIDYDVSWTRDNVQIRGDSADDANFIVAFFHDPGSANTAAINQVLQTRLARKIEVGAQE